MIQSGQVYGWHTKTWKQKKRPNLESRKLIHRPKTSMTWQFYGSIFEGVYGGDYIIIYYSMCQGLASKLNNLILAIVMPPFIIFRSPFLNVRERVFFVYQFLQPKAMTETNISITFKKQSPPFKGPIPPNRCRCGKPDFGIPRFGHGSEGKVMWRGGLSYPQICGGATLGFASKPDGHPIFWMISFFDFGWWFQILYIGNVSYKGWLWDDDSKFF